MINVIDAAGNIQNIGTLPDLGPTTAANGIPLVGISDSIAGTINTANANYLAITVSTTPAPTAGSSVDIETTGYSNLVIQVSNTSVGVAFTGTMQVQGTVDGTNWVTLSGSRLQTYAGTIAVNGITAAGIFIADVSGLVRARVTSTTAAFTNSASVFLEVTSNLGLPSVLGAISTVSTVSVVTSANLGIPFLVADAGTSAAPVALAATATTAAITPSYGCSYEVNIFVSAVSGTSPTMDVVIQESDDNAVTAGSWFDVYHFERITATGTYRSPKLPLTGTRIRYVQTLGGTGPSFTRAINRLQSSDTAIPIRRFFDRTIAATTTPAIGTASAAYTLENSIANLQLVISAGTITTPSPIKLQGSEDASNWYDIPGATLTPSANATTQVTVANFGPRYVRAITHTTAGVAQNLNYVCIKAFD